MTEVHVGRAECALDVSRVRWLSFQRVDPLIVAYLSFTFVLVVTPGSTTAVVVRNTLVGGRGAGLAAAVGAAAANTSHATAAGLGLAVVFARWPLALALLRLAGAAYLGWLGLAGLYRAARLPDGGLQFLSNGPGDATTLEQRRGGFREGLTVNILNPAIATFYLVVVPSFLPAGAPRWYFVMLAAMHIMLAFTCHGLWAIGLDRVRRLFRRPGSRRFLEGATGVALIALALRVFMSN
jgi:threonine/homoserine/homoserine lactone efflux protein